MSTDVLEEHWSSDSCCLHAETRVEEKKKGGKKEEKEMKVVKVSQVANKNTFPLYHCYHHP
jgi:hypothetical protein